MQQPIIPLARDMTLPWYHRIASAAESQPTSSLIHSWMNLHCRLHYFPLTQRLQSVWPPECFIRGESTLVRTATPAVHISTGHAALRA